MKLESKVADFFIKHKLTKVLLALSGGVDSVVCLHLLAKLKTINSDFNLRVIHVQHNLQPDSSAWAEFCRNICQQLDLSLIVESVEVKGCSEIGVEAAARAARYDAFANNLQQGECLVTAQHLDDQAETFLLQSLRGSGVAGLSAMPALKQFASGLQARPLLSVSRSSIQAYADDNKLQWVEDPSNQDPNFARNAIRHAVLPELKKIRSGAAQTLSQNAENCAAANECLLK
jgi:tRNA(Ile)-lysidine synthetase, N-terminal domain